MVQQRDVLVYPDPRLREVAPVVSDPTSLAGLVDDLVHTMFMRNAVGIAATQVGELARVFVLDPSYFIDRGTSAMVFVNPEIVEVAQTSERRREGCLSFPGYGAHVVRPSWVRMRAQNLSGEFFEVSSEGDRLLSLALQHELDHLDGVVMVDKADKRERKKVHEAMTR